MDTNGAGRVNKPNVRQNAVEPPLQQPGKAAPVKQTHVARELPATAVEANNNHYKPIASRESIASNPGISNPFIAQAQQQIHNLALQQSQVYSGMVLMHPSQAGYQGLYNLSGLFYQQPSGQPLVVGGGGSNLPAHLLQQYNELQNTFIQNQMQIMAALSQQMALLQLQIRNMIQQLASRAIEALLQPQQFLYLLPPPVMQPQPIALNTFTSLLNQPQQTVQSPWLPMGWQIQPGTPVIKGFPAPQSQWIPGYAPLPPLPQTPGFYYQPQPPAPKMMFQNPMLPYAGWMNWVSGGLHLPQDDFYHYMLQHPPIYPGLQPPKKPAPKQDIQKPAQPETRDLDPKLKALNEQLNRLEKELSDLIKQGDSEQKKQLSQLQADLVKLRKELTAKTKDNSYLTGRLSALEKQLEVIRAEKDDIAKEKDQLANDLRTLKSKLIAAQTQKQISEEELEALRQDYDALKERAQNDSQARAFLEGELESLAIQLHQLQQENQALQQQQREYTQQILALRERLAAVSTADQSKSRIVEELNSRLYQLEQELSRKTGLEGEFRGQIKGLSLRVDNLVRENQTLYQEKGSLNRDIKELRRQLGEYKADIKYLERELFIARQLSNKHPFDFDDKASTDIKKLEEGLQKAREDIAKKEEEIKKLTEIARESASNDQRIKELEGEITELRRLKEKSDKELFNKQKELTELRAYNEQLREQISELQLSLYESGENLLRLSKTVTQLTEEAKEKDTIITELRKEIELLNLSKKEKEELQKILDDLDGIDDKETPFDYDSLIKKLNGRIGELDGEEDKSLITQLRKYLSLLENHKHLKEALSQKEREIQSLKDKINALNLTPKQKEELETHIKNLADSNTEDLHNFISDIEKRILELQRKSHEENKSLIEQLQQYKKLAEKSKSLHDSLRKEKSKNKWKEIISREKENRLQDAFKRTKERAIEIKKEKEDLTEQLSILRDDIQRSTIDRESKDNLLSLQKKVIDAANGNTEPDLVIEDINKAISAAKGKISSTTDDKDTAYINALEDLRSKLTTLKHSLAQTNHEKTELENQIHYLTQEKEAVSQELKETKERSDLNEAQKFKLDTAINILNTTKLTSIEQSAEDLETAASKIKDASDDDLAISTLADKINTIAQLLITAKDLSNQVKEQESKQEEAAIELKSAGQKIETLKKELKEKQNNSDLIEALKIINNKATSALEKQPRAAIENVRSLIEETKAIAHELNDTSSTDENKQEKINTTQSLINLLEKIEAQLSDQIKTLEENKELKRQLHLMGRAKVDTESNPLFRPDKSIIDEIKLFQSRIHSFEDKELVRQLNEVAAAAISRVDSCTEELQHTLQNTPEESIVPNLDETTAKGITGTQHALQAYAKYNDTLSHILSDMDQKITDLILPDDNESELSEVHQQTRKALKEHILEKIKTSNDNSELRKAEIDYLENSIKTSETSDEIIYKAIQKEITKATELDSVEAIINRKLLTEFTDAIFEEKQSGSLQDELDLKAKSYRAVEVTRKVLCDIKQQKEKLIGKEKAKSLDDVERLRKNHSKLCKIIRLCHSKNLSHHGKNMTPFYQQQLNTNVENALRDINLHVAQLEWTNNKTNTTEVLKSRLDQEAHQSAVGSLTEGDMSITQKQVDISSKMLEKQAFINDVIWMVQRQKQRQAETDKGQSELYKTANKNNFEQQHLISSEKILNELCVIHGFTDKPAMAALLIALAKKTTDINSPVIDILSERYSSEPGLTKKKELRNKKFLQHCITLLEIEAQHKQDSLFRGCPINTNGMLCEHPHREELQRFSDLTTCYFEVENASKSNGQITGYIKPHAGVLGKYFLQATNDVIYKEQPAVGERIISDQGSHPPLIFTQRKGANGHYGKLSVELLGTRKECDQRLYLTYPNYESPFNSKGADNTTHQDSIPLSDSLETGELLRLGNKSYYYKLVENLSNTEQSDTKPILKCIPISSDDPNQETLDGALVAWAACASSEKNHYQLNSLAKQAWQAYEALMLTKSETPNEGGFLAIAKETIHRINGRHRHWFDSKLNSDFESQLKENLKYAKASLTDSNNGTHHPDLSNVRARAPDSLQIEAQRKKKSYRGTEAADTSALPSRRLPGDFDLQQEKYLEFMQHKLGTEHPTIDDMIYQRRQEREHFKDEVFPEMLVLKNCQIKSTDNLASINRQIKNLKQHCQFQKEENIGRIEDMAKLGQLILQLMPDDKKPCNLDDAKNHFANHKVSEQFAQTMMAYITLESAQHIAAPISQDIENVIVEMEKLERNRTLMTQEQFQSEVHKINFKNFEIANRLHAMQTRAQHLSREDMNVENVSARLYEVFRRTQLRDYQIKPAGDITKVISNMASADREGKGSENYRLNCQWGTGFGKTEMAKLYSMQACREGIGAIYIAPKENVDNFDIEMQRFANSQESYFQRINIEELTEKDPDWWKKDRQLDIVLKMIKGLAPHGNMEEKGQTVRKIPASMSTTDLQIILQLHQHLSQQPNDPALNSQNYRSLQKLEEMVRILSGTGLVGEAKPFIIRDECDTFTDAQDIAETINRHLFQTIKSDVSKRKCYWLTVKS